MFEKRAAQRWTWLGPLARASHNGNSGLVFRGKWCQPGITRFANGFLMVLISLVTHFGAHVLLKIMEDFIVLLRSLFSLNL